MSKLNDDLYNKFLDLTNQLSPENLHCDGEISNAEAEKEYKRLMKQWRSLEVIAGREVTEDEIWQRYYDEMTKTMETST
jgi:type I site-specific restriction-modification system R (restriction) subunit